MELFLFAFGALFSLMNPLGTVPIFVGLTQDHSKSEKNNIALRTSINVLIIIFISFFTGKYLLSFFGISLNSLKIAGGLIIASSGFALLTGKFNEHKGMKKKRVKEDLTNRTEIALTPLAIPMLAGPGTISLLITYRQEYTDFNDTLIIVSAMVFTTLIIFLMLKGSNHIEKILGASGINALSRIIGFIVIAIGIEHISVAIFSLIKLNL